MMAPRVSGVSAVKMMRGVLTLLCLVAFCYSLEDDYDDYSDEKKESKKRPSTALSASSKEVSVGNFVGLVAMRLVFSLAYMMGLGDWASGVFNGALAPPGSDYDDYGDYRDEGGDDYGDDDYAGAFDF